MRSLITSLQITLRFNSIDTVQGSMLDEHRDAKNHSLALEAEMP